MDHPSCAASKCFFYPSQVAAHQMYPATVPSSTMYHPPSTILMPPMPLAHLNMDSAPLMVTPTGNFLAPYPSSYYTMSMEMCGYMGPPYAMYAMTPLVTAAHMTNTTQSLHCSRNIQERLAEMKENLLWKSKSKSVWKDTPDLYDRAIFRLHSQATVFDAIIRSKNPRMPPKEAISKAVRYMEENSFWRSNPLSLMQCDESSDCDKTVEFSYEKMKLEQLTVLNNVNMNNDGIEKTQESQNNAHLIKPDNEGSPPNSDAPISIIPESIASDNISCSDWSSQKENISYSASMEIGGPCNPTLPNANAPASRKTKKKRRKTQKVVTKTTPCETSTSVSLDVGPLARASIKVNRVRTKRLLKKKRKRWEGKVGSGSPGDTTTDPDESSSPDESMNTKSHSSSTNLEEMVDREESRLPHEGSHTMAMDYRGPRLTEEAPSSCPLVLSESTLNQQLGLGSFVTAVNHIPTPGSSTGATQNPNPNKSYAEAVRLNKDHSTTPTAANPHQSMANNSCCNGKGISSRPLSNSRACTWAEMCRLGKSVKKNNHNFS